jgi:hypothetical protein
MSVFYFPYYDIYYIKSHLDLSTAKLGIVVMIEALPSEFIGLLEPDLVLSMVHNSAYEVISRY